MLFIITIESGADKYDKYLVEAENAEEAKTQVQGVPAYRWGAPRVSSYQPDLSQPELICSPQFILAHGSDG